MRPHWLRKKKKKKKKKEKKTRTARLKSKISFFRYENAIKTLVGKLEYVKQHHM
jgi:hypothetical protein